MTPGTVRDLLLARAGDDRPGLLAEDAAWSWREVVTESAARAAALTSMLTPDRPPHVGVLLDNVPELAFLLGGAALGGQVVVGLNTTRRGPALAGDIARTDCQLVLTDAAHRDLLPEDVGVPVIDAGSPGWEATLAEYRGTPAPAREATPGDLVMLIFTSGTSGEPKAVRVTDAKITIPGLMLADRFGLGPQDVVYVAMPMFHSNAIMAGWAVGLAAG
ncbi:MAG: AMP-binding protein, partial [Nocardioides sp.]